MLNKENLQNKIHDLNVFLKSDYVAEGPHVKGYKTLKASLSAAAVAEKLVINAGMLQEFEVAMYNFSKHIENPELQEISGLRFGSWLETITQTSGVDFAPKTNGSSSDYEKAIKQVRALELILRDVIQTHTGGEESLIAKISEFLKKDVVQKWKNSADDTGVLSGTTFSELSSLFLDKRFFASYDELFPGTEGLLYDKKKQKSLRYFLDDIRIIRNSIAHNKKISDIKLELLNAYYKEVTRKIDRAHVANLTDINPKSYLSVSNVDFELFLNNISVDIDEVREGVSEISEKVDNVLKDTSDIKKDTEDIKELISKKFLAKKMLPLYGIIICLFAASAVLYNWYSSRSTSAKIKFMWRSDVCSIPFSQIGQVKFITENGAKDVGISDDGMLEVGNISSDLIGSKLEFSFNASRVYALDTPLLERKEQYLISLGIKNTEKAIFVIRDNSSGNPVEGAKISFLNLKSYSNDEGRSEVVIPDNKRRRFIDFSIIADGYEYQKLSQVPVNSQIPIEILLQRK